MKLASRKKLFLFIGICCIAFPIVLAVYISARQSYSSIQNTLIADTQDVLFRANKTAEQINVAFDKLLANQGNDPCSSKNIRMMRGLDLNSSNIQAIGYVSDNLLKCSSLNTNDLSWNLGPVELITSKGVKLRLHVSQPESHTSFLAVEKDHYVAIIHKSIVIETAPLDHNLSLALFTVDKHQIGTFRGYINPKWLDKLGNKESVKFIQDGYAVSIIKSKKYLIGAIAAKPFSYYNSSTIKTALILMPVAGLAGFLFAFLITHWMKLQLSASAIISGGLRRKEFFVVYQPVMEIATNRCVGVEALMRWTRESGETIPPDVFIPLAEKSGIIQSLTEYVIESIAKDVQDIFHSHPDFHIAINVSAEDLHSTKIIKKLDWLIHRTNAQPNNFIIEATERKLMKIELANQTLKHIREKGMQVAIDDFGTGYSNLAYLETLELDYLKIDKAFVDVVGTGSSTSQVILHIIKMAKALNLKIIAEGVENLEQAEFIHKQGVQYGQGWHYGKPVAFYKIVRMLKEKGKPLS